VPKALHLYFHSHSIQTLIDNQVYVIIQKIMKKSYKYIIIIPNHLMYPFVTEYLPKYASSNVSKGNL